MSLSAQEIAAKYKSPRYLRLELDEEYVKNAQYEGRAPFMSNGPGAPPLQERKPCVKYNVINTAIWTLIDFMMGENRYPQISACSSEDDEEIDEDWGLNEDDSSTLERWLNGPLTKAAKLRTVFPDALSMAMGGRSVALVASIRQGLPTLTALPAKWCSCVFNAVTGEVDSIEVFYPYIVETKNTATGKWEDRCMLYRRVIDGKSDTVFLPGEGREDGTMPSWTPDPRQSVDHGLGFCPVVWYAHDRRMPTAEHYDGHPIHHRLHEEADGLNLALSQRHQAAIYTGSPQMYETGVDANVQRGPAGMAARPQIELMAQAGGKSVGIWSMGPAARGFGPGGSGGGNVTMKGPGIVWRYPSPDSKVDMVVLPVGSLGAISEHAADLRSKMAEDMSVVFVDAHDVKAYGAMSGKALAFLFARQIAKCDRLRREAGDGLILKGIDLLMRLCMVGFEKFKKGLRLPGMAKVMPILQRFMTDIEQTAMPDGGVAAPLQAWFGPQLDLEWGPYFQSSAEEENFIVTMCVAAYGATLMPLEIIIEKLRDIFPFKSSEEILEKLEEAQRQKDEKALAIADQQSGMAAKYAPDGKGPASKDAKPSSPYPFAKKGSASGAKGDKKA